MDTSDYYESIEIVCHDLETYHEFAPEATRPIDRVLLLESLLLTAPGVDKWSNDLLANVRDLCDNLLSNRLSKENHA
jgi:hypothetical protein